MNYWRRRKKENLCIWKVVLQKDAKDKVVCYYSYQWRESRQQGVLLSSTLLKFLISIKEFLYNCCIFTNYLRNCSTIDNNIQEYTYQGYVLFNKSKVSQHSYFFTYNTQVTYPITPLCNVIFWGKFLSCCGEELVADCTILNNSAAGLQHFPICCSTIDKEGEGPQRAATFTPLTMHTVTNLKGT